MVEFCREHSIPFDICGKIVVATDEAERAGLGELMRRASENGVPGLTLIGPEKLREIEPHCTGIAALQVPGTGITDYKQVARKYAELIEKAGGRIITGCECGLFPRVPARSCWKRIKVRLRPFGSSTAPGCTATGS